MRVIKVISILAFTVALISALAFVTFVSRRSGAIERAGFTGLSDAADPDRMQKSDPMHTVMAVASDVESLSLDSVEGATPSQAAELKHFPELKNFCIRGPFDEETLKALRHVPNLESIGIDSAGSDAHLVHLKHCPRLKSIMLIVPEEVSGTFLDSLTCTESLETLEIFCALEVEDDILPRLKRFPNLQRLVLEECWFDGSQFHVLRDMKQLKYLSIDLPSESVRQYLAHIPDVKLTTGKHRTGEQ